MFGVGVVINSFDDIEQVYVFLICGVNLIENYLVVGVCIKQVVFKGVWFVVIDLCCIELVVLVDVYLFVCMGCNVLLLNVLVVVMIEEGCIDWVFLIEWVSGFDIFVVYVVVFVFECMVEVCGVFVDVICVVVRIYVDNLFVMCFYGFGVIEYLQGSEGVMVFINLVLFIGNFGKFGSGINFLCGQNNV